jgi:hypothetical protein
LISTTRQIAAQIDAPKTKVQIVEETIERWGRLTSGSAPNNSPSTVQTEVMLVVLKDNAVLIEEVQRLREELMNLRMQRRLENVRELETQFPRKGRRR